MMTYNVHIRIKTTKCGQCTTTPTKCAQTQATHSVRNGNANIQALTSRTTVILPESLLCLFMTRSSLAHLVFNRNNSKGSGMYMLNSHKPLEMSCPPNLFTQMSFKYITLSTNIIKFTWTISPYFINTEVSLCIQSSKPPCLKINVGAPTLVLKVNWAGKFSQTRNIHTCVYYRLYLTFVSTCSRLLVPLSFMLKHSQLF